MQSILDFCDGLPKKELKPGDVLLQEGECTGRLYFLIRGRIEIVKGEFRVNSVCEPGSVFGEVSALTDRPHMATVRVQDDSEVYVVENADGFLQKNPDINYFLSKLLAQRLQNVTGYLVDLKRQFEDQNNHLGMVDEVLGSLVNQQADEFSPGSDRDTYDRS